MKKQLSVILFILLMILQSCSKDVGPVEPDSDSNNQVSFKNDVQPIFNNHCISCHPSSGDLDLREGHSYNEIVGVSASGYSGTLVVPGNAEASVLYKKIDGSGAFGSNMPLGGSLSANQIKIIRDWINQGAKNN